MYDRDVTIIYQGHVPHMSLLILDGKVSVSKRNKLVGVYGAGDLIGASELYNNQVFEGNATVYKNSRVVPINKTTLIDIFSAKDQKELKKIFDSLLEVA